MSKKFKFPSKHKKAKLHLFSFEEDKEKMLRKEVQAHIELFCNREITIEGCLGIFEYKEDYIKLRLLKGSVILCGKSFYVAAFENKIIRIKGIISSVEFCV